MAFLTTDIRAKRRREELEKALRPHSEAETCKFVTWGIVLTKKQETDPALLC